MENQANQVNTVLSKKMEGYSPNMNNFVAPGEITVTITLSEYRELVESKATRDAQISEANTKWYEAKREADKLKEDVQNLRSRVLDLQDKLAAKEEA